jgi:16S rRNA (guanine527-N7)-methyltransferase
MEECRSALPVLLAGARTIGITLDSKQKEDVVRYCSLLQEWNSRTNLTAIRTPEGMMQMLFLDALALIPVIRSAMDGVDGPRVIDVGAGAGFPSLPLKVVCPDWDLTLLEATGKKARFLEAVVGELELRRVTVINARAEDVGRDRHMRDGFDLVLARAVSALPSLVELCAPFARVGGTLVLPKSGAVAEEAEAAQEAAGRLGVRLLSIEGVNPGLGLGDARAIVVYGKERPTPQGYPRRTGLAQSRPLGS